MPDSYFPDISEHLAPYNISAKDYILRHSKYNPKLKYVVASSIVPYKSRILLIQRSAGDLCPRTWEIPGGGCEDNDESILSATCRELEEEVELTATAITKVVDDHHDWPEPNGDIWRKITFIVEYVCKGFVGEADEEFPLVKLNPDEHMDFVWATEEEVISGTAQGRKLVWTTKEQEKTVLDAFKILKMTGVSTKF